MTACRAGFRGSSWPLATIWTGSKAPFLRKSSARNAGDAPYASPDMQSTCPLEEGAWLVGTAGDGLYILLTRMGETFFAPQTWFEEGRG